MLFQICAPFLLAATPFLLMDTTPPTEQTAAPDAAAQPAAAASETRKSEKRNEKYETATTQPVPVVAEAATSSVDEQNDSAASESADSRPAETWTLRYNFTPDQKLRYETHQTMTLEATLGENRRVDNSELKQRRVFTVLSVEDSGAAHVAMQFEHVWMKKQIDDLDSVEFDSTMKADDVPVAFRQVAHSLKGSAPKYWMSNRGLSLYPPAEEKPVRTVENKDDEVQKSSISLVEGSTPGSSIELAVGSDSQASSLQKKKDNNPGSFLMTLPEEAVKVGDTWKETISVSVRVTTDINREVPILRTFRLDAVENGIATISFRSSIETSVKGATLRSQLIQATPRGTIAFDIERGVMLRRLMRYNETVVGALGNETVLSSVGTNTEALIED